MINDAVDHAQLDLLRERMTDDLQHRDLIEASFDGRTDRWERIEKRVETARIPC